MYSGGGVGEEYVQKAGKKTKKKFPTWIWRYGMLLKNNR